METPQEHVTDEPRREFQPVAECLYRRVSTGVYYAFAKRAGKKFKRSLKTTDRKIAERKLADFRREIGRLSDKSSASRILFRELANRWLETQRAHLKPSSFARRETSTIQLCRLLGGMTIRQITSPVCEEWANKRGVGLQASTYNNERDTLILILAYAGREGLLLDNPAKVLPRRKLPRSQVVPPAKEQFARLVEALRGDTRSREAALLVQLLAFSGTRLREATAMRWQDVDFGAGRFTVTGGETGTKNHEARAVPLFQPLASFLERLRAERSPTPSPGDFIIQIASAKRSMEYACRRAGLPDFTHHTMRHFFVSNAIEVGIDYKVIAAWIGHKDGGLLVARTYGHLRDTHSTEMAKRITFSLP